MKTKKIGETHVWEQKRKAEEDSCPINNNTFRIKTSTEVQSTEQEIQNKGKDRSRKVQSTKQNVLCTE